MNKLAIVVLTSILLAGCNRLDAHQPLTSTKVLYKEKSAIAQSFISSRDNLNIVSVCIRNPDRLLAPMRFDLYEATLSGEPIRSIPFSTGNIDNQDCTRFQFEPAQDSKNKTYVASMLLLEDEALQKPGTELYVEAAGDDEYKDGSAFQDTRSLYLDLHFKTHYRQPRNEVIQEAFTNFVRRLPQDPSFMVPYTLLLIAIIAFYRKSA